MTQIAQKQAATPTLRWWHALAILLVANLISWLPAGFNGEEIFYNSFKLPALAPPDWLFAPVWLFNNITSLWALSLAVNNQQRTTARTTFIWAESINWVLFAVFSLLYFGLKSPVLGAIDTALGLVCTTVSLIAGYNIHKKVALGILPRFLWLLLATYVSVYVALYNQDAFFS